jgi:hypothetical protein
MASTSSGVNDTRPSTAGLRVLSGITLLLLGAQFMIGMLVNFYIQVPAAHPGAEAANYFQGVVQAVLWILTSGPLTLLLHAAVGLTLFLASIILIILAIIARRAGWIVIAIIGFIGVVGAGFNGASFVNYGHDFSSLLMSIGFLLAAICYVIGFAVAR